MTRVPIHPILVQQKIPGEHDGNAPDPNQFIIESVTLVEDKHHQNGEYIVPAGQQEKSNDLGARQISVAERPVFVQGKNIHKHKCLIHDNGNGRIDAKQLLQKHERRHIKSDAAYADNGILGELLSDRPKIFQRSFNHNASKVPRNKGQDTNNL